MRWVLEGLITFWFLLPALIANPSPGWATNSWKLPFAGTPVCRWLGPGKTWGAWYVAPIVALLVIHTQAILIAFVRIFWPDVEDYLLFDYQWQKLPLVGLAFGCGVALGDHLESALKRLVGVKDIIILDQIDFLIGALLLVTPLTVWVGWHRLAAFIPIFIPWYLLGNWQGVRRGHRKKLL